MPTAADGSGTPFQKSVRPGVRPLGGGLIFLRLVVWAAAAAAAHRTYHQSEMKHAPFLPPPSSFPSLSFSPSLHLSMSLFRHSCSVSAAESSAVAGVGSGVQMARQTFFKRKNSGQRELRRRRRIHAAFRADATEEQITPARSRRRAAIVYFTNQVTPNARR